MFVLGTKVVLHYSRFIKYPIEWFKTLLKTAHFSDIIGASLNCKRNDEEEMIDRNENA